MGDYYIPLSELLGAGAFDALPWGAELHQMWTAWGVRQWEEDWNATHTTVRGTGVVGIPLRHDFDAFQIALGTASDEGSTEFEFEFSSPRRSLVQVAAALGEEALGIPETVEAGGGISLFFRGADAPPTDFRLVVRGLSPRLKLDRARFRKGELIVDTDGKPVGIKPLPAGTEDTVEVTFLPLSVVFDTKDPRPQIELADDQLLELPPMLVMNGEKPMFGIWVKKLKVDIELERSPPEALAAGYDEAWRGIYFEEIVVFGLDAIHPGLPKAVGSTAASQPGLILRLERWFLGTDGISGKLEIDLSSSDQWFKELTFGLELDRGNIVRIGGGFTIHAGTWVPSVEFSVGPGGDLRVGFNARANPNGGLLTEFLLETPGNEDKGLLSLGPVAADVMLLSLNTLVLYHYDQGILLAFTTFLLGVNVAVRWAKVEQLIIDGLIIRQRENQGPGTQPRFIDFVLDVRFKIALDIDPHGFPIIPRIKTKEGHPLSVRLRGVRISWCTNYDDITEERREELELDRIAPTLDTDAGISFEVGDETVLESAPVTISRAGIGQWDSGVWFEIGVRMTNGAGNVSFSVMPAAMRFWFDRDWTLVDVTFVGAAFSMLVPGVFYARGLWDAGGEATRISGQALLLGEKGPKSKIDKPEEWWLRLQFSMREQTMPADPEPVRTRLFAFDAECKSGIPLGPIPASLYGIGGLYAENARPGFGSQSPGTWLMQAAPAYQIDIDKWEAVQGASGWAASIVLGATGDSGRPWNLKAGFMMLEPGPVLALYGTANFMKERLETKSIQPAALSFIASLDLASREFLLGLRFEKKWPDDTGRILHLVIPAELLINDPGWHIYIGRDKPKERMVTAKLFGEYDIAGYLMVDTEDITDLASTGITVPGTAFALGARFEMSGGHKGSHLKLYFYLNAAADLAIGSGDPTFILVRAKVAGGLVAKAWGIGFELELAAEFMWVRPEPDVLRGLLEATLDLPWPIPNISWELDLGSGTDGDGAPLPMPLIGGLSMQNASDHSLVEVIGEPTEVPLDAVFTLAFEYSTRSGPNVAGTFNVTGGSSTTFHFVGGEEGHERGYAVTLESLSLLEDVSGASIPATGGPFAAIWRPEEIGASAGLPARSALQLFEYQGIASTRFVGAAAEYIDGISGGFQPCGPVKPPSPVCYRFDEQPLGAVVAPLRLGEPEVRLVVVPDAPFAESARRYFGSRRGEMAVVASPLPQFTSGQVLRLPSTDDAQQGLGPTADVAFELQLTHSIDLLFLRHPNATITVRSWHGTRLVDTVTDGASSGHLGERKLEIVRYTVKGPLDRITIETVHVAAKVRVDSYLVELCAVYERDYQSWQDAVDLASSWSTFWSDLLEQSATGTAGPLLKPNTRYTIEAKMSWAHRREDGTLSGATQATQTWAFRTTNTPPAALRGPTGGIDATDWQVRTTPAHEAIGVYVERALRIELQDPRTDKLFALFGKRLVLRLVDELGVDIFDQLAFLREHARDLPEYQRAWRDFVLGLTCAAPGIGGLWTSGVAHFTSVLQPSRRYLGTLVLVPDTVTDLSTVTDWPTLPVVYRFEFTTSAFRSLVEHVAACLVFDETCEREPDLTAANAALGGRAVTTDLTVLENVMHDHLALLPRVTPQWPEVVRVWRRTPTSEEVIGLLIDSSGPLCRPDTTLEIATSSSTSTAPTPIRVGSADGARALVLFASGGAFVPLPVGDLTLTFRESYIWINGNPAEEVASVVVPIPAASAASSEETPP